MVGGERKRNGEGAEGESGMGRAIGTTNVQTLQE